MPCAALVAANGVATSLALSVRGLIYAVNFGPAPRGILAGKGSDDSAYGTFVSVTGKVTPLAGLPVRGAISWISVNPSKRILIGGQDNAAAFGHRLFRREGKPIARLPLGSIYRVAVNNAGAGVLVSHSQNRPYPALVSPKARLAASRACPPPETLVITWRETTPATPS